VHAVKKGKADMIDTDLGLQVVGKPFGDLPADPVLAKRSLNKQVNPQQEE
jgi:hypothetical protein